MADIVVFGLRDFAQLAHFYFKHDSDHRVVAFTVHEAYMPAERTFEGVPVVPFESLVDTHPPDRVHLFAPMSHLQMNRAREAVYRVGKDQGYTFASYVSSKATVFPDTPIGDNCFILEDNTIQPFTQIGSNVMLWSGNHIGHHSVVHDHVLFTSHVVLSGHCVVHPYSFFGVNATIRNATTIGEGTLVGMGACVTRDTDPWGVYIGNPAKKQEKRSDTLDF